MVVLVRGNREIGVCGDVTTADYSAVQDNTVL